MPPNWWVFRNLRSGTGRRSLTDARRDAAQAISDTTPRKISRSFGLKLEAAKERMRVNKNNVSHVLEVVDRLQKVRSELVELRQALNIRK